MNGTLNGAGETLGVILAGSNLGILQTAGWDFGLTQRIQLQDAIGLPGALNIGFNGTLLNYYHFQATPNSINRDCTGVYSTNCTNPRPKFKSNARVTYSIGRFDASLLWTHISSVKLEPFNSTAITPLTTPQYGGPSPAGILAPFQKIKAYDYFDFALHNSVGEHFDITFTVDNLLNRKPPLVGSGVGGTAFNNGNTFPTVYDVIGRAYTVGVKLKF